MAMRLLTPLLLLILSPILGFAQANPAQPLIFYRGTEYTKVITTAYGIPFLYDEIPGIRKVQMAGQWYEGMELHYDAEDDALVTLDPKGDIRIQLVREKVNAFVIGQKSFRRIGDSGYFEEAYQGQRSVYVKWQKVLVRKGVDDPYYRIYRKVYVAGKEGLEEVNGKGDLLRYFGVHKKKAADYIRARNLNFRSDLPRAAAALLQYADQNGFHE
jgi:hypothetical protein